MGMAAAMGDPAARRAILSLVEAGGSAGTTLTLADASARTGLALDDAERVLTSLADGSRTGRPRIQSFILLSLALFAGLIWLFFRSTKRPPDA